MRLVNMDVDRFGTNDRCRLGTFSSGLNAVCGPRGTGKTTLVSWLQQIVEDNSLGTPQNRLPATGAVEIRNKGEHFLAATDRNGRLKLELLSDYAPSRNLKRIPLSEKQRHAFAGLAEANGLGDSEKALDQLAHRLALQLPNDRTHDRRPELLARERDVESKLARIDQLTTSRASLVAQKERLEIELQTVRHTTPGMQYSGLPVEHRRLSERLVAIEQDLRNTLEHTEQLDRELAAKSAELELLDRDAKAPAIEESYRAQLKELDDRLNRWRQTLRDLKSHRETIEHNATDARLDKEIGDQLSTSKDADPRASMRSLEAQILNTRAQLDLLVDRYSARPEAISGHMLQPGSVYAPPTQHGVYRDASGRTYLGATGDYSAQAILPETLRSMQKDLHEVCQQLARHEAKTSTDTLKQQAQQLQRCEAELLQAVEKLIEERAQLLRRIANEHHISVEQLTLAFGQWCQCHDHPHLHDWLLSEEATHGHCSPEGSRADRQTLLGEVDAITRTKKQAELRADDCRRQLREANHHQAGIYDLKPSPTGLRDETIVRRELERVLDDLAAIDSRDVLTAELSGIRHDLQALPVSTQSSNRFQEATDRFVAALMPAVSSRVNGEHARSHYDIVDGVSLKTRSVEASRYEVPNAIVRIAMRLAIAEAMNQQGEPISVVIDQSFDDLPLEIQQSSLAFIAAYARKESQQILVMTSDERVAEIVRANDSWVGYMQSTRPVVESVSADVNQRLNELANDEEGQKWTVAKQTSSEFFLQESSLIEDLPAIDPKAAARCRALGIDRIGDLLDVDPQWLAENIRLDGVSHGSVVRWQATARLLCSVRNLRPFDARVLVGAGIRTPNQLAEMHPSQLLDRVEHFLTTERGRRILQTGNSYELSRITSWIASAKGSGSRFERSSLNDDDDSYSRSRNEWSNRGNGYDRSSSRSSRSNGSRGRSQRTTRSTRTYPVVSDRDEYGNDRSRRSSSSRSSSSRSSSSRGGTRQGSDSGRSSEYESRQGTSRTRSRSSSNRSSRSDRGRTEGGRTERGSRSYSESRSSRVETTSEGLRFYLELESPVVDAPTIGPRMATRLEQLGIITVSDLLMADAEAVAEQLELKRVDADEVISWQSQASLVCRIPNLRGHDAQLLVACDYTSPEELANLDPATVLEPVLEVARSKDGQRILRGGKEPDLEEVQDWIQWAANHRILNAA